MTNGAGGGSPGAALSIIAWGATTEVVGVAVAPALVATKAVSEAASGSKKERFFM
jgi:hypothetical protein